MSTPHYFIALELPSTVKQKIDLLFREWSGLSAFKQTTHTDDLHLTLAFLGAVEETDFKAFQEKLAERVTGSCFQVTIDQVSFFGKSSAPRIFWVGPERSAPLVHLYDIVQQIVFEIRGQSENRPFRPHITLAKTWLGDGTFELPEKINPIDFTATTVSLFRIHPKKTPKYEVVAQYNLASQ